MCNCNRPCKCWPAPHAHQHSFQTHNFAENYPRSFPPPGFWPSPAFGKATPFNNPNNFRPHECSHYPEKWIFTTPIISVKTNIATIIDRIAYTADIDQLMLNMVLVISGIPTGSVSIPQLDDAIASLNNKDFNDMTSYMSLKNALVPLIPYLDSQLWDMLPVEKDCYVPIDVLAEHDVTGKSKALSVIRKIGILDRYCKAWNSFVNQIKTIPAE